MLSLQLILLTAVLNCSAPADTNVAGFWESEQTSKGGIGHTLEFQKDGSYLEAVSIIVDQRYHYENSKLTIIDPQEKTNNNVNVSEIKLDLMTLTEKCPDGSTLRKERADIPLPEKPSIIGIWRYRHYTGAIAYERYAPDGLFQFRLPMTSSSGCYNIEGDQLIIIKNSKEKTSTKFRLRDGKLELESKNKTPFIYRLEKYGPWYQRDKIDYQPPAELQKQ
jgi:hypothetical protein